MEMIQFGFAMRKLIGTWKHILDLTFDANSSPIQTAERTTN